MATLNENNTGNFVFGRINYILLVTGIVIIIVGFVLMVGGAHEVPEVFNAEDKYSFTRITLAPIVIVIGLIVEFFAIMIKSKD